ncbi:hypothetical protein RJT34_03075 [Clitoria ternatea]|uniref:Uncharacterized protein n=1 Tax=Clitoria ternatea TaxID=43366 RepID=A0AAN9KK53_CLITE
MQSNLWHCPCNVLLVSSWKPCMRTLVVKLLAETRYGHRPHGSDPKNWNLDCVAFGELVCTMRSKRKKDICQKRREKKGQMIVNLYAWWWL